MKEYQRIRRELLAKRRGTDLNESVELGGKSPVILSETTDIVQSAQRIMATKTLNGGQICLAPNYLFLPAGKEDAFVKAATEAVTTMFPTLKDNRDYTSIINQRQFDRLQGLLQDAREKGATIVEINPAGEDFSQQSAGRIPPTLVLGVDNDMRILQEEIFGPLLPVLSYTSMDAVLGQINAGPRPLAIYYLVRRWIARVLERKARRRKLFLVR